MRTSHEVTTVISHGRKSVITNPTEHPRLTKSKPQWLAGRALPFCNVPAWRNPSCQEVGGLWILWVIRQTAIID